MRICQLELQNFRGIESGTIVFTEHCVLFGPNNVGKSTIIDALALLFERERITRQLSDWDFSGGNPNPASRITIIGTITDFSSNDDEPENFPLWFNAEAARPIWWCPDTRTVSYDLERPAGGRLAVQIAVSIRFEEETCEFECIRHFYFGPCDPFVDEVVRVPGERLNEVGLFLLPSNRQWDRLLSFGSSSFMKLLKTVGAIPGRTVEALKCELRSPDARVEDAAALKPLLQRAEQELKSFLMLEDQGRLVYRPTSLDTLAVLQSIVPHVLRGEREFLPFARHGAGMISLQSFLIVAAFAEKRKSEGKNFIFAAEEPELHLFPSLHRRLANRIRSVSTQSIITTHSPLVAAGYQPANALFLRGKAGRLEAIPVHLPAAATLPNRIAKLYRRHRESVYEALMGAAVLIPEGESDCHWLQLLQRVVEGSELAAGQSAHAPITIIPTSDAAVTDTFKELSRFRPDAVPLVDGDPQGTDYLAQLEQLAMKPMRVIRYGTEAAVECLAAWVLEPALAAPGPALQSLFSSTASRTLKALQEALYAAKDKYQIREDLAWCVVDSPACVERAGDFMQDLASIASGSNPNSPGWQWQTRPSGVVVFTATHITKN
jgi:predicted ATP-dependent endonuclease of OLD family